VTMARKFRFGVQISRAGSGKEWTETARKIEDLGFSTLLVYPTISTINSPRSSL
jgi:hypothetical protein